MLICPNCFHQTDRQASFCEVCGTRMAVAAQAVAQAPAVQQPAPVRPSKAKQIVGMALSIDGLASAAVCLFYGFYPFVGVIAGPLGLAVAIVGYVMSRQNEQGGFTSKFTRVGKNLGLAGIIAAAASIVLSAIGTVLFFVLMVTGSVSQELYYYY